MAAPNNWVYDLPLLAAQFEGRAPEFAKPATNPFYQLPVGAQTRAVRSFSTVVAGIHRDSLGVKSERYHEQSQRCPRLGRLLHVLSMATR